MWIQKIAECPQTVSPAFVDLKLSEKDLHKHVMLEKVPFDVGRYNKTGEIDLSKSTIVIVHYPTDSQVGVQWFHIVENSIV
jgi:hypothetical protein